MLKRILVPLDGSGLAERALTYATELAIPTGATLLLVRAVRSHTLAGVDARERQIGAIQEAEAYLEQVAVRLRAQAFTCETVVRHGPAAECVAETARTRGVDLIVITSHGRTGPGRLLLGSVAESLVARSPIPVLVNRAWQPLFGGALLGDHPNLIVPVDGSAFSETALDPAARLAQAVGGKLVLVRVEDDPTGMRAALEYLPRLADWLSQTYPGVAVETDVRVGEAAYGLQEAIAQKEASLVVMATHGHGGVLRTILGSVAGTLMQHIDVPIVLIRPLVSADEPPLSMAATANALS